MEYVSYFKTMCHQARLPLLGQHVRRLKRRRPPFKSRNNQNSPVVPQNSVPQPSQSMNSNNSVDNNSVMIDRASTASTNCSENHNEKIKFNIKSNSAVRPHLSFEKHENIDKRNNSVGEKTESEDKQQELIKTEIASESKVVSVKTVNVKEEPLPKTENAALFCNKQDVQILQPLQLKSEKWPFEPNEGTPDAKTEIEQPLKENKLQIKRPFDLEVNKATTDAKTEVEQPLKENKLQIKRPFDLEVNKATTDAKTEIEQPLKKNRLQIKRPFDLEVNKATSDAKADFEQPLKKNKLQINEFKQSEVVGLNLNISPATMSRIPFVNLNKRSPFDNYKILDQEITALLKRIRTQVEAEILKK